MLIPGHGMDVCSAWDGSKITLWVGRWCILRHSKKITDHKCTGHSTYVCFLVPKDKKKKVTKSLFCSLLGTGAKSFSNSNILIKYLLHCQQDILKVLDV